jgi:hypothetical protein
VSLVLARKTGGPRTRAASISPNESSLAEERARRRRRWSLRALHYLKTGERICVGRGRRMPGLRPHRTDQVELRHLRHDFGFLLRFVARGYGMTKVARMRAVEGFLYRLGEGIMPGVAHQHGRPGKRLQRHPVQAHGKTKRENRRGAAYPENHTVDLTFPKRKRQSRTEAARPALTAALKRGAQADDDAAAFQREDVFEKGEVITRFFIR